MAADGMGVRGVDQLVRSLDSAAAELGSLDSAHAEVAQLVLPAATQAAPRATGYLANHHTAVVTAGQLEVANTASYAGYVHAHNPWLAHTLDQLTPVLLDTYADGVADVVDTITGV